jgi:hypothetical protein
MHLVPGEYAFTHVRAQAIHGIDVGREPALVSTWS